MPTKAVVVVEKALLVVLTRHLKLAMSRLVRGSVPDQVMREAVARCSPFLPGQSDRVRRCGRWPPRGRHGPADPAHWGVDA